jgi:hypothetical protein
MLAFLFSPIGRYVVIGLVSIAAIGGVYTKGRLDGRASYKAKIERQIDESITSGNEARDRALGELNAGRVPEHWLRD